MSLRTPARYVFSNPATGYPMLLTLGPNGPAVFTDHRVTMAISLRRDADDLDSLSRVAATCTDIHKAAALLRTAHECHDLEAEFDPTTPEEQARIDGVAQLGAALDALLDADALLPDVDYRRDRLIRGVRELIESY